jgi:hypothetical protein
VSAETFGSDGGTILTSWSVGPALSASFCRWSTSKPNTFAAFSPSSCAASFSGQSANVSAIASREYGNVS